MFLSAIEDWGIPLKSSMHCRADTPTIILHGAKQAQLYFRKMTGNPKQQKTGVQDYDSSSFM